MLPREQRAALLCFSDCSSPSSLGGRDRGGGGKQIADPGEAGTGPWLCGPCALGHTPVYLCTSVIAV